MPVFLKRFLLSAISLLAAAFPSGLGAATFNPQPPALPPFVDALPIPPVLRPGPPVAGAIPVLKLEQRQFLHAFHRDLSPTAVWGYDDLFPGPTIEVRSGEPLKVEWHNALPLKPLFPIENPQDLHGVCGHLPPVRTAVHLHGALVSGEHFLDPFHNDDGYPDAWILPGQTQKALYPNRQEAACLWYHDHAVGLTARNNYGGLSGFYIIRDAYEDSLRLPKGPYEIPLMIQARFFRPDGGLDYPSQAAPDEVYGDVTVVNGKIWPYLKVEARLYRFRVLNASNARSYALKLLAKDGGPGPAFHQIGSDGGFLPAPVLLNDPQDPGAPRLDLAPAERADILIDFSGCEGRSFTLNNNSQTDLPANEDPIPDVLRIEVGAASPAGPITSIPRTLRPITRFDPQTIRLTRRIFFSEPDLPGAGQMMLLNGLHWEDPVVERPLLGSLELWELVNETSLMHPFHMHSAQFQVLNRQPINLFLYEKLGAVLPTWKASPPALGEEGWKDTVKVPPGAVTRIIVRFGPYTGRYVYHCHILEHEDMDMMRPFEVVADPKAADQAAGAALPETDPNLTLAKGPLALAGHYQDSDLGSAEDREQGFDIEAPLLGKAGHLRFLSPQGRVLKERALVFVLFDANNKPVTDATRASVRMHEAAHRSGRFAIVSSVKEKLLSPWEVLCLSARTEVYDHKGGLCFGFDGRGRVEAAPGGKLFVWLPEVGDGDKRQVQGPVFFDGHGRVVCDRRRQGQAAADLDGQISFSPNGRYAAIGLSAPVPALEEFKDGKPYETVKISSPDTVLKARPFDNGDLACMGPSDLVFYHRGRELRRDPIAAEACLVRGDKLFCVAKSANGDSDVAKAMDLIRVNADGTDPVAVQGLRGVAVRDAGLNNEIKIVQDSGEVFVYRLR